nr:ABC transporter permease [Roseibium litorale]
MKNVFYLGLKEFSSLSRDAVMMFLITYSFTFAVYEVATGVQTDVKNASIAIVDGDHSQLSRRLADALLPPYFNTPVTIDRSGIDQAMDRGTYTFVIDVPPGFERDILAGRTPGVQVNVDATAMTQAGNGSSYISEIVSREIARFLIEAGVEASLPVDAVVRTWFNPNLDPVWFNAVMQIIDNLTILSVILVGAAVIREREHGTIEHLLVMPVGPSEIAFAKVWANGLVVLSATMLSLVLMVRGVLGVPVHTAGLMFFSGAALYIFAITSLGILLATIVRSMPQFGLLAMPAFVVMNMLSGAITPVENMPEALQVIMQVSPTLHFVAFAQAVLYRGADFQTVWPQFLGMALTGGAFMALALARFRAMLATQG